MFPEERFEPNFAEIFGIGGPFGSPSRMRELIEQIEGSDCGNPNCPVHGRGRKAQPKGWIAATDKIRRDGALGIKVNTSEQIQNDMVAEFTFRVNAQAKLEGKTFGELAHAEFGKLLFDMSVLKAQAKAAEGSAEQQAGFLMQARNDYEQLQRELTEARAEIGAVKDRAREMENETYGLAGSDLYYAVANAAYQYIAGNSSVAPTFPTEHTISEQTRSRFLSLRTVLRNKNVENVPTALLNDVYVQTGVPVADLVENYFPTPQPEPEVIPEATDADGRNDLPVLVEQEGEDTLLDLDIPESSPAGITDERPEDRVLDLSEEVAVGAAV